MAKNTYAASFVPAVCALGLVLLQSACGACFMPGERHLMSVTYPLPVKERERISADAIGLHVPDVAKVYRVEANQSHLIYYEVAFGKGLEPNAAHALSKLFREVVLIKPVLATSPSGTQPARRIALEIENATFDPGASNIATSAAEVRLKAVLSRNGDVVGRPIAVFGKGLSSAGCCALGPTGPALYQRSLQQSIDGAMTSALDQLLDEITLRVTGEQSGSRDNVQPVPAK